VHNVVASLQFARIWIKVNTVAHQELAHQELVKAVS